MLQNTRNLCLGLTLFMVAASAAPVAAQTPGGSVRAPAKSSARAAQRAPQSGVRTAANNQPAGEPRYETKQAAAQQPAGAVAAGPAGAVPAGAPRAGVAPSGPVRDMAPKAPFVLTQSEQALLDQILIKWEKQSDKVKSFKCNFGWWAIDETWGPKENDYVLSEGKGYIKYRAPDRGVYRVTELSKWDREKNVYKPETFALDHWMCNGEAIFEFNYPKKQLIERQLAPEMRGKAITDGPLPFIFGAKAEALNRRYWMRDITPTDQVGKEIRLEAWPKYQADAANFEHAVIILSNAEFMPTALRLVQPGGKNTHDYAFSSTQVNDPLAILKGDFLPPMTPLTWQKVVEPAGGAEVAAPPTPAAKPTRSAAAPADRK